MKYYNNVYVVITTSVIVFSPVLGMKSLPGQKLSQSILLSQKNINNALCAELKSLLKTINNLDDRKKFIAKLSEIITKDKQAKNLISTIIKNITTQGQANCSKTFIDSTRENIEKICLLVITEQKKLSLLKIIEVQQIKLRENSTEEEIKEIDSIEGESTYTPEQFELFSKLIISKQATNNQLKTEFRKSAIIFINQTARQNLPIKNKLASIENFLRGSTLDFLRETLAENQKNPLINYPPTEKPVLVEPQIEDFEEIELSTSVQEGHAEASLVEQRELKTVTKEPKITIETQQPDKKTSTTQPQPPQNWFGQALNFVWNAFASILSFFGLKSSP